MNFSRIIDILPEQLEKNPLQDLYCRREDKKNWTKYSTQQSWEYIKQVGKGLIHLGLQPGDKVAIISTTNRPEWNFIDQGCLNVGIIDVPVYPTISPAEYEYIFNNAEVKYVFLSDKMIYKKVAAVAENIPSLKKIFCFDEVEGVESWKTILQTDSKLDEVFEQRRNAIQPDDIATIIYTSGTTGFPKGVMLTHHNIVSNVKDSIQMVPVLKGETTLSFLPVCHVFERTLNYVYLAGGASIYYADGLESIAANIADVRPHVFATVPRLLEKVYEGILKKGNTLEGFQKEVFSWSMKLAQSLELGKPKSILQLAEFAVADKLVYSKWRAALGGRLKAIICGSAPLQPKLATIFTNGGIPVLEGYGLTETSPVLSVVPLKKSKFRAGCVGQILPSVQVKIAEDGEILVKGPNVMKGYYKNEEATKAVFNADGWFLTGDIGEFTKDNFLKITDRKKELFKTSGGKYVAPAPIENKMKESLFIEQMALVGDGRKFVGALIIPAFDQLKVWCKENNVNFTSKENVIKEKMVQDFYWKIVNEYNVHFGKVEQVKMIELLPNEWTTESGELTPTMKLKRKVIADKYKEIIESFYD
ncbi:MAG: long-chain fatty acid--CoA ligase [Chitinophagales bacterium]|nr:long-chain fatty acid--CoA ligase [Chitinophagales bacterium]